MSLSSETARTDYTANGSTLTYAYDFKILDDDDIKVIVRLDSSGAETTLTKTTHYSVTGVDEDSGGNVVFVAATPSQFAWIDANSKVETGWHIAFLRDMDFKQETDLRNQGAYYPENVEDQFDKLVMMIQQVKEIAERGTRLPPTEATSAEATVLPAATQRVSTAFEYDASGDIDLT